MEICKSAKQNVLSSTESYPELDYSEKNIMQMKTRSLPIKLGGEDSIEENDVISRENDEIPAIECDTLHCDSIDNNDMEDSPPVKFTTSFSTEDLAADIEMAAKLCAKRTDSSLKYSEQNSSHGSSGQNIPLKNGDKVNGLISMCPFASGEMSSSDISYHHKLNHAMPNEPIVDKRHQSFKLNSYSDKHRFSSAHSPQSPLRHNSPLPSPLPSPQLTISLVDSITTVRVAKNNSTVNDLLSPGAEANLAYADPSSLCDSPTLPIAHPPTKLSKAVRPRHSSYSTDGHPTLSDIGEDYMESQENVDEEDHYDFYSLCPEDSPQCPLIHKLSEDMGTLHCCSHALPIMNSPMSPSRPRISEEDCGSPPQSTEVFEDGIDDHASVFPGDDLTDSDGNTSFHSLDVVTDSSIPRANSSSLSSLETWPVLSRILTNRSCTPPNSTNEQTSNSYGNEKGKWFQSSDFSGSLQEQDPDYEPYTRTRSNTIASRAVIQQTSIDCNNTETLTRCESAFAELQSMGIDRDHYANGTHDTFATRSTYNSCRRNSVCTMQLYPGKDSPDLMSFTSDPKLHKRPVTLAWDSPKRNLLDVSLDSLTAVKLDSPILSKVALLTRTDNSTIDNDLNIEDII